MYLHGGTKKGIQEGDILGVYKNRRLRVIDPIVKKSPMPFAHIKVYRAEPLLTSAFVLDADGPILPGDETGPPHFNGKQAWTSEKEDLSNMESGLETSSAMELEEQDSQESGEEDDLSFDDESDFESP